MPPTKNKIKANILVIDDKPENLDLLGRVLDRRGYQVNVANGHKETFDLLETWQPDLILLDIMMPEVDGYVLCEQLKKFPKTAETPIIFLSALTEMFDKVKAFAVGGVDYVTKPYQITEVVARIETHLKMAQLQKNMQAHNLRLQQEITERKHAEQALKNSQRYLSTLLSNLPGVVYRRQYDATWTMEFMSEGCLALTGYPNTCFTEHHSISFKQLIPAAYQADLIQQIETALAHKVAFQFMYPIINKASEQRWVWEKGQGIFNHKGQLEAIEGFIQDITVQQQAQQALDQTQQQLMIALETIQDGFVYYDASDQLFFCNHHFQALYQALAAYIKPGVYFESFLRHGFIMGIYDTGDLASPRWLEYRMTTHRKGGSIDQQLTDGKWLQINEQRTKEGGYVALHIDISERKYQEARLRQLNQKLLFFIHETPLAYIEWDTQLKITHWNSAAEHIFGYHADDVLGNSLTQFIVSLPSEDRKAVLNSLNSHYRINNQTKDRREIICEWYNTPLVGEQGEIIGFAALAQDVTQREQIAHTLKIAKEQAEMANQAKTAFLANMSHELRTPLNSILGYTQILLRDHSLSEKQHTNLAQVHRSGEHLLTLINDLLDFSRIEAGRLTLNLTQVRIDEILRGLVDLFSTQAQQKQLDFNYQADSLLQHFLIVKADGRRLRQILLNLLSNAVKFTNQGQINFIVCYQAPYFKFMITDTGCGIADNLHEKIFLPFQQGEHRYVEGTGLGLAISYQLVGLMGGCLEVASEPNIGSAFSFELNLPLLKKEQGDRLYIHLDKKPIYGYTWAEDTAIKILLVGEQLKNRIALYELLHPLGFLLRELDTIEETLVQANTFLPDVILIQLDELDQVSLRSIYLLRQNPIFQDLVIIVLAENIIQSERVQAMGCNCVLNLPLVNEELLEQLAKYCQLTWQYEPVNTKVAAEIDLAEMTLPPIEVLNTLFYQIRLGNVKAILTEADRLLLAHPEAALFLKKVQSLAYDFEMAKLKAILHNISIE